MTDGKGVVPAAAPSPAVAPAAATGGAVAGPVSAAAPPVGTTPPPPREHGVEELDPDCVASLTKLYDGGPRGRFLTGAYGTTHYLVEEPLPGYTGERKVAILSHGIGTSLSLWDGGNGAQDSVPSALRARGYTVVRYDFLGHGWSQATDKWIKYTNEIFVSQLEDLVGHIMTGKSKEIALFCGHSTGGLVGILACEQLKHKFTIKDLVLVSPALWKEAPLIVKIGDRMPGIMWNLLSSRPLRFLHLPKGTYLENCDSAFGKDPATRQFTYPDAHAKAVAWIKKMFDGHPNVEAAILGVGMFFLVESNLVLCRSAFTSIATRTDSPTRILLLWGDRDIVVPYATRHQEAVAAGPPGRVQLCTMSGLGHEAMYESSSTVVKYLTALLDGKNAGDATQQGSSGVTI